MPSHNTSHIFVIGGTGAQGLPVIGALVADKKYSVRALSRDPNSRRAKALLALGNVEIIEGTFADEATLRKGFQGCDGAFINIDGFNTGEKTEMYWAIRSYEIAIEEGIKFFVYGNLDYALKKSGYDSRFRAGHYDGKGRIAHKWQGPGKASLIELQKPKNQNRQQAKQVPIQNLRVDGARNEEQITNDTVRNKNPKFPI